MRLLKYTMVYIMPLLFLLGILYGSWISYAPILFAFGVIPLAELIFRPSVRNLEKAEAEMLRSDKGYDLMLYLVLPAVYLCIGLYLFAILNYDLEPYEITGYTISLGVILGGLGINVAHELGHRSNPFEQILAQLLLLPSGYMHFFIEHNRGHHKNVSTHEDPASARYGESVYHFWLKSVVYSYISAWQIENKRLQRAGIPIFSLKNEMLRFQIIQLAYWVLILSLAGPKATLLYTEAAVVGFLMLETVNYIEHYGLRRKKINEFRYEKVEPAHSWNSNHIVGRIMLFELSRHSDHHYLPAKKYQILAHHDKSPQMPTGYPGMMLLSLLPPLWFSLMNKRIALEESKIRAIAA